MTINNETFNTEVKNLLQSLNQFYLGNKNPDQIDDLLRFLSIQANGLTINEENLHSYNILQNLINLATMQASHQAEILNHKPFTIQNIAEADVINFQGECLILGCGLAIYSNNQSQLRDKLNESATILQDTFINFIAIIKDINERINSDNLSRLEQNNQIIAEFAEVKHNQCKRSKSGEELQGFFFEQLANSYREQTSYKEEENNFGKRGRT